MTDLVQQYTLSSLHKRKIKENLDRMISDTPKNREMKEKIYRSLIGDYTEADILEEERQQQMLLEQIDREMQIKECVGVSETKVFFKPLKEICDNYIEDESSN